MRSNIFISTYLEQYARSTCYNHSVNMMNYIGNSLSSDVSAFLSARYTYMHRFTKEL